jgi:adenosylmethionine-8-amino-7-oxononanoate aminotransferase
MFAPLTFEALRLPSPGGPCPHSGRPAPSLDESLAGLDRILADHGNSIAAIIMEPLVQAAAGIYVHPSGFLRGVADLARRHDVLLILDEVATGFGRTGTMFACEQEGVSPDFLCLAKGLTGGYLPMAATLTTERVWNAFIGSHADRRTFFHGHTYGGNPLAAAVGIASLDVFRDERVLESLPPKIARLQEHVARLSRLDHVGNVRQCGLVAGLDLVADKASGTSYPWQEKRGTLACLAARRHGALLRQLGAEGVDHPVDQRGVGELDQARREEVALRHPADAGHRQGVAHIGLQGREVKAVGVEPLLRLGSERKAREGDDHRAAERHRKPLERSAPTAAQGDRAQQGE